MDTQVVWFKRDLRVADHAPLSAAAAQGPVLALVVDEPSLQSQPDVSAQHLGFFDECVDDLRAQLHQLGLPLLRVRGEMPALLARLRAYLGRFVLHSHEETGNLASYARDRAVACWCREHAVAWYEYPSNGVVRRLKDRNGYARIWQARMAPAPLPPPSAVIAAALPFAGDMPDRGRDVRQRQRGGLRHAARLLDSFLTTRGIDYRHAMSSPLSAAGACSRLSPYLSFGQLSIRQVLHALGDARRRWADNEARPRGVLPSLKSFESRLHWHCHFIQKLESEPQIEARNLHAAYDGLREQFDPVLHAAWARGETGFPMVDACMRMLLATGWVNFRMRAMLVSFASYQLWQPWRPAALHLAREFLDYEPGIHYPQVQMQSGTTGINTARIYNPVKQALDQDPDGIFVRRWIPALARVPAAHIFEPWRMPPAVQQASGCMIGRDYPAPVIDLAERTRAARTAIYGVRRSAEFRESAQQIHAKHGSRLRRGARPKAAKDPQADLFG